MRCLIQGISHDGQGVGRIDGKVVFVPGALPGEDVDLKIVEEKKNYLRGRLTSIITSAPERVDPPCPYFGQCGGCHYQHAGYDLQVDLKTRVVEQTLQRVGGVETDILPCVPAEWPWQYRNKVTWHGAMVKGHWKFGYYRGESNEIMDIDSCLLVSDAMQEAGRALGREVRELNLRMPVEVSVRESISGEIMSIIKGIDRESARKLCLLVDELIDSFYLFDGKGVHCLKKGREFKERLAGIGFSLSPLSFFQVNRKQAEKLVAVVQESLELQGGEQVLDAYCGVGTLALSLAGQAKRLVGVESFPTAVEDANKNARLNGICNCRFLAGFAEQILPTLSQRFEAVVLDPPRAGCQPQVIKAVERMKIPRVVYVSCEPSTLARDLARFQQAGYCVKKVQPIDMFPQTYHVETVVLMSRKDK